MTTVHMNNCPYCGDHADLLMVLPQEGKIAVECNKCGLRGPMADQTEDTGGAREAIELWNYIKIDIPSLRSDENELETKLKT